MIYTRPTMHDDWSGNGTGMDDFVCTNAVNYFIRDNKLHAVVQMRSNDVVFGYRNDVAWQRHVQRRLADDLIDASDTFFDLKPGSIIWNAASLHVYPRHFGLVTL